MAIDNKPTISHVIEKFPKNVEIVVALGHKGELVRDYLTMAHDDRDFTFVKVDNYSGPGSGLGHSILCCEKELQCPFVFCPNDTIVLEDIPPPYSNWMGHSDVVDNIYRTLTIRNERVDRIYEKNTVNDGYVYIGLCGINQYEKFWSYMKEGVNYGSIEIGESYGLSRIIERENNITPIQFTWFDTGSKVNLKQTKEKFFNSNSPEILEKSNEAIWFVNNKVIKYFDDASISQKRVARANKLVGYVPDILSNSSHLYSYKMIKGKTLSKVVNNKLFDDFLLFARDFWKPIPLDESGAKDFKDKCVKFYKEKTLNRINKFFNRFNIRDEEEIINGVPIPKISNLLDKIDWEYLCDGVPTRYHGDFHFENILVSENGEFVFLDWRQDFSGILDYGDIYYDFAKLMHGFIVNHEIVNKDCFELYRNGGIVNFDIMRKHKLVECENIFKKQISLMGYDVKKVQILTSLIFLIIAALHHEPYGEFLFYLGKHMLHGELND